MDDPVPMYEEAEGGSLEDDLRRIAEASNSTSSSTPRSRSSRRRRARTSLSAPAPTVDSGDPDTDDLIRRLLREDAEEDAASRPAVPAPPPNIVKTFFDAIKNENSELISAFIDGKFVTVDTKDPDGVTPLVAAVRANHVRVVQQLVDYGADVNGMATEADREAGYRVTYKNGKIIKDAHYIIERTPLMVAAENGHMPLVKLFVEVFHAKDDIVPSDGMIALRLAAQNGHRDIVDFLPARRIGGMQRWKYRNRTPIRRAKRLLLEIYSYLKFLFYEIPKFFVWTTPKHLIVLPIRDSGRYLWKHKRDIANGIKNGFVRTGVAIKDGVVATGKGVARVSKRAAIGTVNAIKAIPSVTARAARATGRGIVAAIKGIWRFFFHWLPRAFIREIKAMGRAMVIGAKAIWRFFFHWLPRAFIRGIKAIGRAMVISAKAIWKFFTVQLPNAIVWFVKATIRVIKATAIWIKDATIATAKAVKNTIVWIVKQLWKTLTVRIPKAIVVIAKWLVDAVKYTGHKIADLVIRIVSAFHTLLTKLVNWFAGITWKDVLNGFLEVFKFIFVEIPKMIWEGVKATAKMIKRVLEALFGWVGSVIYWIGFGLLWFVTYVPQKLFALAVELFNAIGRGLHEVAVWINPKKL
ncbi:hypothetical protein ABW21_db0204511 [Orbilia brochopaga]|nr:hypothetical protein ABW21_db0204511 [Drechslerella brochopaga]